jgi:hypothetical protein
MPRPKYYRRQSDLCLQLALLQTDPHTKLLLVELAKELQAKADEPAGAATFTRWIKERPRTGAYRVTPPDPPRRRRGPESPPA